MAKVLGIDLGTTYSTAAVVNDFGQPEIFPNREGERITPSAVFFDGETPLVGTIAKQSAPTNPLNTCQFVKRQMGVASWKFRTEDGTAFTPEEVSALILKRLKEDAEMAAGESFDEAVITVPAYFNDAQRKATQDAGMLAGLNVLRIINEPTAAALTYGLRDLSRGEVVLVYDLGGGTFDVTVMEILEKSVKVIATGGDKNLGGVDWDNEIIGIFAEFIEQEAGIDPTEDPALLQDLRDKAEIAKKALSSRDRVTVFLSAGHKNLKFELTRDQFEERTASLLKRASTITKLVVEDSGLSWNEIDKVLLVGGSTRMVAVSKVLQELHGQPPSKEVNPDEVVALGAAIQGAIIASQNAPQLADMSSQIDVSISDVTSHSLGVLALDENECLFNSIILKKNSQIPTSASSEYSTVVDEQEEINVQIVQGEDKDPDYVTVMMETTISVPPYPKGAPLRVSFSYDADGRIQVEVFDLTANRSLQEIEVARPGGLGNSQLADMKKKMDLISVQ